MNSNGLRVVFDTNVFRQGTFEDLSASPMLDLCRRGRVVPIYGHVVFEESLRAYGNGAKREALVKRWIPFMFATAGRLCNDFNAIWHDELVRGRGPRTRIFMDHSTYDTIVLRFANIPLDGSWKAWQSSKAQREEEDKKRLAQREISKSIRQEVIDWKKAIKYNPRKHGTPDLDRYLSTELDHAGPVFIEHVIPCKNSRAVAGRWLRNKADYPFFTEFIMDMAYMGFYAATRPNDPIDLNAQADLNVMAHLLHSDALVSDEQGFLQSAFDDLWKPRGKLRFTTTEFIELLRKM